MRQLNIFKTTRIIVEMGYLIANTNGQYRHTSASAGCFAAGYSRRGAASGHPNDHSACHRS
jgi:hypothetical protein